MISNTSPTNIQPAIRIPSSLPSQLPSSNPRKVNRKQKHTKEVPTDHDTAIEFLKNELKTAQTRIVQLDFEIKDKDQKISILLARNKILEEKKNEDLMNKYFPTSKPSSTTPPFCQGPSAGASMQPCSHAVRSCSPHLVCYDFHHQHPHHQLFCQHRTTDPKPLDNITNRVDKIEEELNHIRAFISPSESPDLTPPSDSTTCQSNVAPVVVDDIPDDQDADHNSIASVEEYIPSVGDFCFEDNQLNSIVPTSQLQ